MYTVFRLQRSEAEWLEDSGRILLSWAVFNPNGPTFNCVGLRDTGARDEREIFFRWMHFLGGEDYCLGYIDGTAQDWDQQLLEAVDYALAEDVGDRFRRFPMMNTVPGFVRSLMNDAWTLKFRTLLASTPAFREIDWGRERYLLDKHGPDMFSRAGEELREFYERHRGGPEGDANPLIDLIRTRHQHSVGWQGWSPDACESRPMQDGDTEWWWDTVSSDDFVVHAGMAFAHAWVGAPREADLEVETTFDDLTAFLRRYRHELWPPQITGEWLEHSLGFRS